MRVSSFEEDGSGYASGRLSASHPVGLVWPAKLAVAESHPLQKQISGLRPQRLLGLAVMNFRRVYRLKPELHAPVPGGTPGRLDAIGALEVLIQIGVVGDETHRVRVRLLAHYNDSASNRQIIG